MDQWNNLPASFGKSKASSHRPPSPPGTSNRYIKQEDEKEMYKFNIKSETNKYDINDEKSTLKVEEPAIETEEEEEEKYFCGVCDHASYSFEAYQEHVISQEHVSRAARVFHLDVPTKKQIKEESKDKEIHHCDICDVNCNGDICWTAHLQGAKHKKKEKQKALEDEIAKAAEERDLPQDAGGSMRKELVAITLQEFKNFPEPLIGLEYVTEIQTIGDAPRFYCKICDTKFNNTVKFPHVISVKHRLQVIKNRDKDWAQRIQESCDRRSELTTKLFAAAKILERDEGRQTIRAKSETIFEFQEAKKKNDSSSHPDDDGEVNDEDDRHGKRDYPRHQPPQQSREENKIPALMDVPTSLDLGDGLLPVPNHIEPIPFNHDNERIPRGDFGNYIERRPSNDNFGSRNTSRDRSRNRSRDRSNNRSRNHSRGRSELRNESRDSQNRRSHSHEKRRDQSNDSRSKRGRSMERRPVREGSRSRSGSGEAKDISDEIQEEMKRQARRAEEKRRASERKKRHAERELLERKEEAARKKRRRENSTPPPEAPRLLDEDTKRLVMQNLTELAKCCVTNEADAELALQVSNALTQALLQYRMKNMPASVLQSLAQQQQQQQPQQQMSQQQQQQQQFNQSNGSPMIPNPHQAPGSLSFTNMQQQQQQQQSFPSPMIPPRDQQMMQTNQMNQTSGANQYQQHSEQRSHNSMQQQTHNGMVQQPQQMPQQNMQQQNMQHQQQPNMQNQQQQFTPQGNQQPRTTPSTNFLQEPQQQGNFQHQQYQGNNQMPVTPNKPSPLMQPFMNTVKQEPMDEMNSERRQQYTPQEPQRSMMQQQQRFERQQQQQNFQQQQNQQPLLQQYQQQQQEQEQQQQRYDQQQQLSQQQQQRYDQQQQSQQQSMMQRQQEEQQSIVQQRQQQQQQQQQQHSMMQQQQLQRNNSSPPYHHSQMGRR